jgi:hypothetical protein
MKPGAPDPRRDAGDIDPFGAQAPGVLVLVSWHEPSRRGDDPPPRQVGPFPGEQCSDGAGGSHVAGLAGDLAVGHHLAGS